MAEKKRQYQLMEKYIGEIPIQINKKVTYPILRLQ